MLKFFEDYMEDQKAEASEHGDDFRLLDLEWQTLFRFDNLSQHEQDLLMRSLPSPVLTAVNLKICWIAGGHVRRWINEERLDESDIDLFFKSSADKSATEMLIEGSELGFKCTFRCPEGKLTSYTLERGDAPPIALQCISPQYYEDPFHTIDTFDLTVSQFGWDGEFIYMGTSSLLDLSNKVMVLHSLPYPAATMRRLTKYAKSGFWLPEETALDFMHAILTAQVEWSPEEVSDFSLEGGTFRDGRQAGIDGTDAMRWYID